MAFQLYKDVESKLLLCVECHFVHANGPVSASHVQNTVLKLKIFLRNMFIFCPLFLPLTKSFYSCPLHFKSHLWKLSFPDPHCSRILLRILLDTDQELAIIAHMQVKAFSVY